MYLIHNERSKLLAGVFNTAATSAFAVGVLAPVAAAFYNLGGPNHIAVSTLTAGVVIWFGAAASLHWGARRILGRLRDSREIAGMTDTQLFAFVILPIAITILGWIIVLLNEWYDKRHPHSE